MIHKTRGIVLHQVKYSESSIIAYIYTELFGRQSYIIHGVKRRKSLSKGNIIRPLALLEMQVYYNHKKEIQKVKEFSLIHPDTTIPYIITKNTIAQFLSEIIYKTLREEEQNEELFGFLVQSITTLDNSTAISAINIFHIWFLLHFCRYLGFFPRDNYSEQTLYFSIEKSSYTHFFNEKCCLNKTESEFFHSLFDLPITIFLSDSINFNHILKTTKREVIDMLIEYYYLHIGGMAKIKSLSVLKEVFL